MIGEHHRDRAMNWDHAAAEAAQIAQRWTDEGGPGGAILLFDTLGLRVEACGGLADLSYRLPFRPDTASRYASITKHFFTSLLLTGMPVSLDDRLGDHLVLQPALAAVPVARALDMTGGLPDLMETLWLLGVPPSATLSRHRLMDAAQAIDALNFPPGHEISYSNTGYRLTQAALTAKGLDVAALLQERICDPLGLSLRLVEDETVPVPDLATGYWRAAEGWRRGRYGLNFSASGGIAGTALDLMAWGQALLTDRGPAPGLLDRLTAQRVLADGRPTGYGLGMAHNAMGERGFVGHGGSLPGYRSYFLLDRAAGTGAVVLSNRDDTDAHAIALGLMAALHGETLPSPATELLPDGLFVTESGPFWLRHEGGKVTFLGATETVYDGGDGWAVGRSAHLPMRLSAHEGGIHGEIGHMPRQFRKVEGRVDANPNWAGRYASLDRRTRFSIAVEGRIARLIGAAAAAPMELRAIDANRALAQHGEGHGTQQICLDFSGGVLRMAVNRSRMLRFSRV
jgi:CubicO group peptidase (beta-lactamase class C family)